MCHHMAINWWDPFLMVWTAGSTFLTMAANGAGESICILGKFCEVC